MKKTIDWNKIPKQKYLRENEEKIPGDCWRCCVAAILGMDAEQVPHFLHISKGGCVIAETQKWLNEKGYVIWKSGEYHTYGGSDVFIPVISCGPTIRSEKRGDHHAVVTNGWNTLYDPHPSNAGILYEVEEWRIFKLI